MIRIKAKFLIYSTILVFTLIVIFVGLFVLNNTIASYFIMKSAESKIEKIVGKGNQDVMDYSRRYETLSPNTGGTFEGVRGQGLNLLLIDQIENESFLKELLTLYSKSSLGEYDDHEFNVPLDLLLAVHTNESAYYDNGRIFPKTLLPWDSSEGRVIWNEPYLGYSADSMTLYKLNSKMTRLNLNSNSIHSSSFKNSFQVHHTYFNNPGAVSKLVGFDMGKRGSSGDYNFLPDSLAYLNWNYSRMKNTFGVPEDTNTSYALFGAFHNGGEGFLQQYLTMGVETFGSSRDMLIRIDREFLEERYVSAVSSFTKFQQKHDTYKIHRALSKGYGVAIWALLEDGYYVNNKFMDFIARSPANRKMITASYNQIYGENKTETEIIEIFRKHNKQPWEVDSYISREDFIRIYGNDSGKSYDKGGLFKWSTETSSLYKNKLNGENPRLLHRTNWEVAGFMWDTLDRGKWVYMDILAFLGVDVDPTNPDSYLQDLEEQGEFVPADSSFGGILKKLGITEVSEKAFKMMEEGYKESGFYYYYGGGAKVVSQENFNHHYGWRKAFTESTPVLRRMYRTKDGTDPFSDAKNRRNENLVHYGRYSFDCSSLVYYAYNNTIRGERSRMILSSSQMYNSDQFVTINKWSEAKPGDIFVRQGHVFFVLGRNTTGSSQTLTTSESKSESVMTVKSGGIWTLEAASLGTNVGIRARNEPSKKVYKLRRFKDLQ